MAKLVLLNSRALGTASFGPLERELLAMGCSVERPSVAVDTPWSELPARLADATRSCARSTVVAHSGAGPLGPAVAMRIDAHALVFLDAHVPSEGGTVAPAEPEFVEHLQAIADAAGVLPPWNLWWGGDVLPLLIADPALRELVLVDLPRLRLDWFDDELSLPEGWRDIQCRYVRLSENYEPQARVAEALGMPTTRIDGNHLTHITDPATVAAAILA